jgi:hypothetical protein
VEDPGIDETPEWRDWTWQETTPDQQRLESLLEQLSTARRSILHVGIGNSSLAARFCASAERIDGITIAQREYEHAVQLGLPRYFPSVANKLSPLLRGHLGRQYDFVVDNNPTTFCCCRGHLAIMFANYAALLKTDGFIVTDTVGLNWTSQPNDERWRITPEEWWAIGDRFGLDGVRFTEYAVGLRRRFGWRVLQHRGQVVSRLPWAAFSK